MWGGRRKKILFLEGKRWLWAHQSTIQSPHSIYIHSGRFLTGNFFFFGSLWLVVSTVKSTIRFFVWELKKCSPKVHELFFIFSIEYSNYWDFVLHPPLFTVSRMVLKGWNSPTGPGPRILKLFEWLLLIILKAFFCVCGTENISALPRFIITLNFQRILSLIYRMKCWSPRGWIPTNIFSLLMICWFIQSLWFLTSPYTSKLIFIRVRDWWKGGVDMVFILSKSFMVNVKLIKHSSYLVIINDSSNSKKCQKLIPINLELILLYWIFSYSLFLQIQWIIIN